MANIDNYFKGLKKTDTGVTESTTLKAESSAVGSLKSKSIDSYFSGLKKSGQTSKYDTSSLKRIPQSQEEPDIIDSADVTGAGKKNSYFRWNTLEDCEADLKQQGNELERISAIISGTDTSKLTPTGTANYNAMIDDYNARKAQYEADYQTYSNVIENRNQASQAIALRNAGYTSGKVSENAEGLKRAEADQQAYDDSQKASVLAGSTSHYEAAAADAKQQADNYMKQYNVLKNEGSTIEANEAYKNYQEQMKRYRSLTARSAQNAQTAKDLQNDTDYTYYSALAGWNEDTTGYHPAEKTDVAKGVYSLYDYINGDDATRRKIDNENRFGVDAAADAGGDPDAYRYDKNWDDYADIDDKQKQVFNFLWNTQGESAAMEYLEGVTTRKITAGEAAIEGFTTGFGLINPAASAITKVTGNDAQYQKILTEQARAQSEHPTAYSIGNVAGTLTEFAAMGVLGAGAASAKAAGAATKAVDSLIGKGAGTIIGKLAGKAVGSAVNFGLVDLANNAGYLISGRQGMDEMGQLENYTVKDYLKDVGTSAISGAAMALASGFAGTAGEQFLTKHNLMTPFMDWLKTTVAGTVGGMAYTGVNYALADADEKPSSQEIATQLMTAFFLSAYGAIKESKAATAESQKFLEDIYRRTDLTVQEIEARTAKGETTQEQYKKAADSLHDIVETVRNNTRYFPGGQDKLNELGDYLEGLETNYREMAEGRTAEAGSAKAGAETQKQIAGAIQEGMTAGAEAEAEQAETQTAVAQPAKSDNMGMPAAEQEGLTLPSLSQQETPAISDTKAVPEPEAVKQAGAETSREGLTLQEPETLETIETLETSEKENIANEQAEQPAGREEGAGTQLRGVDEGQSAYSGGGSGDRGTDRGMDQQGRTGAKVTSQKSNPYLAATTEYRKKVEPMTRAAEKANQPVTFSQLLYGEARDGENATAKLVPDEALTDECLEIRRRAIQEDGHTSVTFVSGKIETAPGKQVRGFVDKATGKVVISVDSMAATATQLYDHENTHTRATTEIIRAFRDAVKAKDPNGAKIAETVTGAKYADQLKGLSEEKKLDYIWDEILANANAGMNAYGVRTSNYQEEAREALSGAGEGNARRTPEGNAPREEIVRGESGERGPPEETETVAPVEAAEEPATEPAAEAEAKSSIEAEEEPASANELTDTTGAAVKIEDFGEKIGGARKDVWQKRGLEIGDLTEMNTAERGKYVKKDSVWPKINYQEMVDSGTDKLVAYWLKTVRDSLPTSPYIISDEPGRVSKAQEEYISFIQLFKNDLQGIKTRDDAINAEKKILITDGKYFNESGRTTDKYRNDHLLEVKTVKALSAITTDSGVRYLTREMQNKQFLVPKGEKLPAGVSIYQFDGKGWSRDGSWEVGTYYVTKGVSILARNFSTEAAAREWIKSAMPSSTAAGRKGKFIPQQLSAVHRTGKALRNDNTENVTGDEYLQTFHFRGGEFGNWVNQNDRQVNLNYAYDAFNDLADALGISVEDISLGGKLAIAFGARGRAGAAAHFEPDREVINLTKMNGAGSTAHEWGHALDFILGKELGAADSMTQSPYKAQLDSLNKLLKDMREKPGTGDEAKAVYDKNAARYIRNIDGWIRNLFPESKMNEAQKAKLEEIRSSMHTGETEYSFAVWMGDANEGDIAKLSELHKEITGRIIGKSDRQAIGNNLYRLHELNKTPAESRTTTVSTDYLKNSQEFDKIHEKQDKGYWSSEVEMFARAFSCYVKDKLSVSDCNNDYLCGHSDVFVSFVTGKDGHLNAIAAFPQGEERARLNEDFDALIQELKDKGLLHQKTDDNNEYNVMRYSLEDDISDVMFSFEDEEDIAISEAAQEERDKSTHIELGMSDAERYEALKGRNIFYHKAVIPEGYEEKFSNIENAKNEALDKIKGKIDEIATSLDLFKPDKFEAPEVLLDLSFSRWGGFKESFNKQGERTGNYAMLAKALINIDFVLDSSIVIEQHEDYMRGTSKEEPDLDKVYVLASALKDGDKLIPVQIEIKKYRHDAGGRIYLYVALGKINEADVVDGATNNKGLEDSHLVSASKIKLTQFVQKIKPENGKFLMYFPSEMLTAEQLIAKKDALTAREKKRAAAGLSKRAASEAKRKEEFQNSATLKQEQLKIIQRTNPAEDDIHTWIRSIDDIKTFKEAYKAFGVGNPAPDFVRKDVQNAMKTGRITVYSSDPIENGNWVTPSKMEAQNYAGLNPVYEKEVNTSDVAWIDELQGQYAKAGNDIRFSIDEPGKTGGRFELSMYHGYGKTADEIYNGLNYPILGQGRYYASTEEDARDYGDNVENANVVLDNPLVIRNDADFAKLTKAAGWEYSTPDYLLHVLSPEEAIAKIDNLKKTVLKKGHDGIVVAFQSNGQGGTNYGDVNEAVGGSIKNLWNTFGIDQVVSYRDQDQGNRPGLLGDEERRAAEAAAAAEHDRAEESPAEDSTGNVEGLSLPEAGREPAAGEDEDINDFLNEMAQATDDYLSGYRQSREEAKKQQSYENMYQSSAEYNEAKVQEALEAWLKPRSREEFDGTESLKKIGVSIDHSLGIYDKTAQLIANAKSVKSVERATRSLISRLRPTSDDIRIARLVADNRLAVEEIPQTVDLDKVLELADQYAAEKVVKNDQLINQRRDIIEKEQERLKRIFRDDISGIGTADWKVPGMLKLNERTAERNMLNIFGDKLGAEVNDYLFKPIFHNEAGRYRWAESMFDKVRKFTGRSGKKSALNKSESAAVQMYIEGKAASEAVASMEMGQAIRNAAQNYKGRVTESMLPKDAAIILSEECREFGLGQDDRQMVVAYARWLQAEDLMNSDKVDAVKVQNAAKEYSRIFDDLYDAINDFLVAHGYEPIGYIKGYAPHMQSQNAQNAFASSMQKMGLNPSVTELPTAIAGLTGTYKPNKRWNPYFLQRQTDFTNYDIQEAFESYIDYMSDVLYHTDDVMRLRQAGRYFRVTYDPQEQQHKLDWADLARTSPKNREEKLRWLEMNMPRDAASRSALAGLYDAPDELVNKTFGEEVDRIYNQISETSKYGNLAKYLEDYADILAGKQHQGDRSMEHLVSRTTMNTVNKIVSTLARAKVAGSLTSAIRQLSQIPAINAELGDYWTARAIADIVNPTKSMREFIKHSDYLTGKEGIRNLVNGFGEKIVDAMFEPLHLVDMFTGIVAVRGKYLKEVSKGMSHEAAMRAADEFGKNQIGSRMRGVKPLGFHSKNPIMQMLNVFQLEAANQWEHISQDLPREYRQKAQEEGKGKAARWLAGIIVRMLLGSFILNRISEALTGRTITAIDPIGYATNFIASGQKMTTNDYLLTIMDNGWEKLTGERLFGTEDSETLHDGEFDWQSALDDTAYNFSTAAPYLRNAMALFGLGDDIGMFSGAYSDVQDLVSAVAKKGLTSPTTLWDAASLLSNFIPGGSQALRTAQGLENIIRGGNYSGYGETEQLKYPVAEDFWTTVQTALFGKYANENATDYYASGVDNLGERQTDAYQTAVEAGAGRQETYEAILDYREVINDEDTPSYLRNAQGRQIIDGLNLSDEDKVAMYRYLLNKDSTMPDKMQTMVNDGLTFAEASEIMDQYQENDDDDNENPSYIKNALLREKITETNVSDENKLDIYTQLLGKGSTVPGKMQAMMDTGLSFAETAKIYDKYQQIDAEDAKASQQATEFSKWIDQQNYTAKQEEAIDQNLYFVSGTRAESTTYDKLTDVAGLSLDDSYELTEDLSELEPEEGATSVSTAQKLEVICTSDISDEDKIASATALLGDSEGAKMSAAITVGLNLTTYGDYRRTLAASDADSQKEVKALIDSQYALYSTADKAAMWQLANKSWKAKNNPYSTAVGQRIYNSLNEESGAGTISESSGLSLPSLK